MKRILFLTTVTRDIIEEYAAIDEWSNTMLPSRLEELGALVTIKRWLDEDIIDAMLNHDVVNFLWAEYYIRHSIEFAQFLDKAEGAISKLAARTAKAPLVINNFALVRWNMDKRYLLDMQKAGFDIPATEIIDPESFPSAAALHERLLRFQPSDPVVLKPSISASSANTHLVADIGSLSAEDITYLDACTRGHLESSLVIQQFEPAIASGEYSFVFVGGKLCNAALKTPKDGEFRCQTSFGGRVCKAALENIDPRAVSTVKSIFDTLRKRFGEGSIGDIGYVRIDGLVTEDRPFVLMEIEAIEPELGLEFGGLNEMLALLMDE
jgi:glutathione synthase/RimK-type ligase-like ATP-grasp enzyme